MYTNDSKSQADGSLHVNDATITSNLNKYLSKYIYDGYCVGSYYSEIAEEEISIMFKCDYLEVMVYPFGGCEPVCCVPFRCNCIAGEYTEDVEVDLYEGKDVEDMVKEYYASEWCEEESADAYGDEYEGKRIGWNHVFHETEGFNPYIVIEDKND